MGRVTPTPVSAFARASVYAWTAPSPSQTWARRPANTSLDNSDVISVIHKSQRSNSREDAGNVTLMHTFRSLLSHIRLSETPFVDRFYVLDEIALVVESFQQVNRTLGDVACWLQYGRNLFVCRHKFAVGLGRWQHLLAVVFLLSHVSSSVCWFFLTQQ